MRYLRKTTKLGHLLLIEEYPAPALGKNKTRPPVRSNTAPAQEALNDKYAAKKLMYKILCNFKAHKDIFVTLTPSGRVTEKQARKSISLFLDRMRRYYKKQGKELKYILITEKQGLWHHHLILEQIPLETIKKYWGVGRVAVSTLDPFDDYKSLAEYLVKPDKPAKGKGTGKQRRKKGARRYTCSQNLREPEVETKELKRIPKTPPRPPKGYLLKEWNKWADAYGELHAQYRCIWGGPGDPPGRKAPGTKPGRPKGRAQTAAGKGGAI